MKEFGLKDFFVDKMRAMRTYMAFVYAEIVSSWADQLLPQHLLINLILCLNNEDILKICIDEFGAKNIIFDKMTALRTLTFLPV